MRTKLATNRRCKVRNRRLGRRTEGRWGGEAVKEEGMDRQIHCRKLGRNRTEGKEMKMGSDWDGGGGGGGNYTRS